MRIKVGEYYKLDIQGEERVALVLAIKNDRVLYKTERGTFNFICDMRFNDFADECVGCRTSDNIECMEAGFFIDKIIQKVSIIEGTLII